MLKSVPLVAVVNQDAIVSRSVFKMIKGNPFDFDKFCMSFPSHS